MRVTSYIWALIAIIVPCHLCGVISDHKTASLQRKGGIYLSGQYAAYETHDFWNKDGNKRDGHNNFEKELYSLYMEYGLTKWNTLTLKGGWGRIEESLNGRTFGFEDLTLGWRHCLGCKYGHLVSFELDAIIPVEDDYKPGLRYGKPGFECNLLLTRGFTLSNWCGSYDIRFGYLGYTGFPSDQLLGDFLLNLALFSRLTVTLGGFVEWGLFNGSKRDDASHFLYNPNYRLFSGEIQATYHLFKGASLFIGYNHHFWGENVGTNGGVYGGAQIQF